MAKLTDQEVFDKVYLGLHSQGFRRSINEHNMCRYRGDYGRKCAAGWIIPDNLYSDKMESEGVAGLHVFRVVYSLVENVEFLRLLQMVHDSYNQPDKMKAELEALAKRRGLAIPEVPSDV